MKKTLPALFLLLVTVLAFTGCPKEPEIKPQPTATTSTKELFEGSWVITAEEPKSGLTAVFLKFVIKDSSLLMYTTTKDYSTSSMLWQSLHGAREELDLSTLLPAEEPLPEFEATPIGTGTVVVNGRTADIVFTQDGVFITMTVSLSDDNKSLSFGDYNPFQAISNGKEMKIKSCIKHEEGPLEGVWENPKNNDRIIVYGNAFQQWTKAPEALAGQLPRNMQLRYIYKQSGTINGTINADGSFTMENEKYIRPIDGAWVPNIIHNEEKGVFYGKLVISCGRVSYYNPSDEYKDAIENGQTGSKPSVTWAENPASKNGVVIQEKSELTIDFSDPSIHMEATLSDDYKTFTVDIDGETIIYTKQ